MGLTDSQTSSGLRSTTSFKSGVSACTRCCCSREAPRPCAAAAANGRVASEYGHHLSLPRTCVASSFHGRAVFLTRHALCCFCSSCLISSPPPRPARPSSVSSVPVSAGHEVLNVVKDELSVAKRATSSDTAVDKKESVIKIQDLFGLDNTRNENGSAARAFLAGTNQNETAATGSSYNGRHLLDWKSYDAAYSTHSYVMASARPIAACARPSGMAPPARAARRHLP